MSKRKILRPLLFLFGIGFIVLLLWRSRETLAQTLPAVNWIIFLLSVGIAVGLNFLIAFLYQKLIHKYGINIEYGLACRIHIYTQVAKYIPGKVWALWYQSIHLNATHATATVLFANLDLTLILITLVSGIAAMLLLFNLDIGIAILVILLAILGAIIQGRYCHTFTATGYLVSFFKKLSTKLCGCSEMISVTFLWGFSVLFACGYVFSNFWMLNAVFGLELSISAV
jgi:hypothetical protein